MLWLTWHICADGRPQEAWLWRGHRRACRDHQELLMSRTWGARQVGILSCQECSVKADCDDDGWCCISKEGWCKKSIPSFRAAQSCALNRLVKADSKVEYSLGNWEKNRHGHFSKAHFRWKSTLTLQKSWWFAGLQTTMFSYSDCINEKLDLWIGICVISEINDIAPRSDFLHALDNDVKVI